MAIVREIVIETDGQMKEDGLHLSLEEAQKIKKLLDELLGSSKTMPYIIPYAVPYPVEYPRYIEPYRIVWSDGTGNNPNPNKWIDVYCYKSN